MSQIPLYIAFEKLKNNLLHITERLLRNKEDASDAVQETFCRLWPIKDRIKSEQEATAMTIRTAKNICIDKIRHDSLIRFHDLEVCESQTTTQSAQDELENKETFLLISQIIEENLSELQKTIFEMKDINGLEVDDIARKLQMQPAAIRMNLSRARKEIRTQYMKMVQDE